MNAVARDIHAQLAAVTRVFPGAGNQPPVNALGPIDLDLRKGEFFAVVGPSGCGKSTFLRTLNRMSETVKGTRVMGNVSLDGENIFDLDVTSVRRRVGMVFQRSNPFPKSIYDNVAYGLRIAGVTKSTEAAEQLSNMGVDFLIAHGGPPTGDNADPSQEAAIRVESAVRRHGPPVIPLSRVLQCSRSST